MTERPASNAFRRRSTGSDLNDGSTHNSERPLRIISSGKELLTFTDNHGNESKSDLNQQVRHVRLRRRYSQSVIEPLVPSFRRRNSNNVIEPLLPLRRRNSSTSSSLDSVSSNRSGGKNDEVFDGVQKQQVAKILTRQNSNNDDRFASKQQTKKILTRQSSNNDLDGLSPTSRQPKILTRQNSNKDDTFSPKQQWKKILTRQKSNNDDPTAPKQQTIKTSTNSKISLPTISSTLPHVNNIFDIKRRDSYGDLKHLRRRSLTDDFPTESSLNKPRKPLRRHVSFVSLSVGSDPLNIWEMDIDKKHYYPPVSSPFPMSGSNPSSSPPRQQPSEAKMMPSHSKEFQKVMKALSPDTDTAESSKPEDPAKNSSPKQTKKLRRNWSKTRIKVQAIANLQSSMGKEQRNSFSNKRMTDSKEIKNKEDDDEEDQNEETGSEDEGEKVSNKEKELFPRSRGWRIIKDKLSSIAEMAPPRTGFDAKFSIRNIAQLVKAKEFRMMMKRRASFMENGRFQFDEAKTDLYARYWKEPEGGSSSTASGKNKNRVTERDSSDMDVIEEITDLKSIGKVKDSYKGGRKQYNNKTNLIQKK